MFFLPFTGKSLIFVFLVEVCQTAVPRHPPHIAIVAEPESHLYLSLRSFHGQRTACAVIQVVSSVVARQDLKDGIGEPERTRSFPLSEEGQNLRMAELLSLGVDLPNDRLVKLLR